MKDLLANLYHELNALKQARMWLVQAMHGCHACATVREMANH